MRDINVLDLQIYNHTVYFDDGTVVYVERCFNRYTAEVCISNTKETNTNSESSGEFVLFYSSDGLHGNASSCGLKFTDKGVEKTSSTHSSLFKNIAGSVPFFYKKATVKVGISKQDIVIFGCPFILSGKVFTYGGDVFSGNGKFYLYILDKLTNSCLCIAELPAPPGVSYIGGAVYHVSINHDDEKIYCAYNLEVTGRNIINVITVSFNHSGAGISCLIQKIPVSIDTSTGLSLCAGSDGYIYYTLWDKRFLLSMWTDSSGNGFMFENKIGLDINIYKIDSSSGEISTHIDFDTSRAVPSAGLVQNAPITVPYALYHSIKNEKLGYDTRIAYLEGKYYVGGLNGSVMTSNTRSYYIGSNGETNILKKQMEILNGARNGTEIQFPHVNESEIPRRIGFNTSNDGSAGLVFSSSCQPFLSLFTIKISWGVYASVTYSNTISLPDKLKTLYKKTVSDWTSVYDLKYELGVTYASTNILSEKYSVQSSIIRTYSSYEYKVDDAYIYVNESDFSDAIMTASGTNRQNYLGIIYLPPELIKYLCPI